MGPSPQLAEQLDQIRAGVQQLTTLLGEQGARPAPATPAPPPCGVTLPLAALQRLLYAAAFVEALLKRLNATLHRNPTEMASIASQAREQAQAETVLLLRTLSGDVGG